MNEVRALAILQARCDGDFYDAAAALAEHMETLGVTSQNEVLTDWLAARDYIGSETINTLVSEIHFIDL